MSAMVENVAGGRGAGPRAVAIVGPQGSGKTTLMEALAERAGAIAKAGSVPAGTSIGDRSREARTRGHGVELNLIDVDYLGERYCFLDCPGSAEFAYEMDPVIVGADVAVVVAEADEKKLPALQAVLHRLEAAGVPRILFINKIDRAGPDARATIAALQAASAAPLLMRQLPIVRDDRVVGIVDLALERANLFREHAESSVSGIPSDLADDEATARFEMLERVADHDDHLMEELLSDVPPPREEVCGDLGRQMREGQIVPVLLGSAEHGNGVTRLFKALRHEAPGVAATRARLGLADDGEAMAQVLKTIQTSHAGKLSIVRLLSGRLSDGLALVASSGGSGRISGLYGIGIREMPKIAEAGAGAVVALGKVEPAATGLTLAAGKAPPRTLADVPPPRPVHALVVQPREAKDDVKLGAALARLAEEDPSLRVVQDAAVGETRLEGQGDVHLRVALDRLQARFGVAVETRAPGVPYRETIRGTASVHGRHKKQSGGHGQFGDVAITIEPRPRGAGFAFGETVTGGAVPRNFFSAIEEGVVEALRRGSLGYPVVDVKVTLTDGAYHSVDSSDQAFKLAAGLAMREGLPKCDPVLLEPILKVRFDAPSEATARVNQIVTGRRGQLLGYDSRPGWPGWDTTEALIPQSEMDRLIVELRSATAGVGTFSAGFDHLHEMSPQLMVKVAEKRRADAA